MSSVDLASEYSGCGHQEIQVAREAVKVIDGLIDGAHRSDSLHGVEHLNFQVDSLNELAMPTRTNLKEILEEGIEIGDKVLAVFHCRKKNDDFEKLNVPNDMKAFVDLWKQFSPSLPNDKQTGIWLGNIAVAQKIYLTRGDREGVLSMCQAVLDVNKDAIYQEEPSEIRKYFISTLPTLHEPSFSQIYIKMLKFGDTEEKKLAVNSIKGFFGNDKQLTQHSRLKADYLKALTEYQESISK